MSVTLSQKDYFNLQLLYFFDKVKKTIVKLFGIIGGIFLFIIFLPIVFIAILIINFAIRKNIKNTKKNISRFSVEEKNKIYSQINNLTFLSDNLFILKKNKKQLFDLKNEIEKKYFPPVPEKLLSPENQEIINEMHAKFSEDWDTDEMNIYNFISENEV